MATLPTAASITSPTTTNAQQKINLGNLADFLLELLGDDSSDKAGARSALGAASTAAASDTAAGLVELATAAEVRAGTDTVRAVTPAGMQANKIVLGTPLVTQSPSSAASYDFTSIPSWVKRIVIMFHNVSTNGSSVPIIQIGDAGGLEVTGYEGSAFTLPSGGVSSNVQNSNGFSLLGSMGTSVFFQGRAELTLMDPTVNRWTFSCVMGRSDASTVIGGGGDKALSAPLDRIRLTTVLGADLYDSGSVNISYE